MKLRDLCTKIGSGATPRGGKESYKSSGTPLIRSQNVLDWAFSADGLAYLDDDQARSLLSATVQAGDLLLNITGDSVARACMAPAWCTPARVNQHVAIIRPSGALDPLYLLGFLQTQKPALLKLASSGATRNALTKGMIENLEIEPPSVSDQRAIGMLISSLQAKVELNRKINDYLAEMAEDLFECWLQAAKGEPIPLSSFASFNPSAYSPKEKWPIVAYVDTGSITRNHFESPMVIDTSAEKLPSRARRKVQSGDVIYSTVRPNQLHYGLIFDPPSNMLVSTGFTVVRDTSGVGGPFIYLALTRPSITTMLQSVAEQSTSTYPSIKSADLERLAIPMPTKEELDELKPRLDNLFAAIAHNEKESKGLIKLRDTLLPKLMTGEIDVSQVELPLQPNNHLSGY